MGSTHGLAPLPDRVATYNISLSTIDDPDTPPSMTAVTGLEYQPSPTPMSICSSGQEFVASPTPMSLCSQTGDPSNYPSQMSICGSTVASTLPLTSSYQVEPVESHGSFEMSGSYSSFRSKVFKRSQELGLSPPLSMYGNISSIQEEELKFPTRARSDSIISHCSWATLNSVDSQQSGTTSGSISGYEESTSEYDSEDTIDGTLTDIGEVETITASLQLDETASRYRCNNTGSVRGSCCGSSTKTGYRQPSIIAEEDENMYTEPSTIKMSSIAQTQLDGEVNRKPVVPIITTAASSDPARTSLKTQPPAEKATLQTASPSRVKQIREQLQRYQEQQALKALEIRQELTAHVGNTRERQPPSAPLPRRGPIPQAARASFVERSKNADIRAAPIKRHQALVNLPRLSDEECEMAQDVAQRSSNASRSKRDKGKGFYIQLEGANPRIKIHNGREASNTPMELEATFNGITLNDNKHPNNWNPPNNLNLLNNISPPNHSNQDPQMTDAAPTSSIEFVSQSGWLRAFNEPSPATNTLRAAGPSDHAASGTATDTASLPTGQASGVIFQASDRYASSSDAQLFREKLLRDNNDAMIAILTQHCRSKINLYSAERIALEKSFGGATPVSHPNHPHLMYSNGSGLAFVDEMRRSVENVRQLCDQQLELVRQMETHYLVANMNFGAIVPQTAGRKRPSDESVLASNQNSQCPEDATIYDPAARVYSTGGDGSSVDGRRVRQIPTQGGQLWNARKGSGVYDEGTTADNELTDEDEQPPLDREINSEAEGKIVCACGSNKKARH
ncbi:hypothetical protein L211DRAFT_895965 [Terfezia boudieri ATCC MYA-4762]|uniref:Uncharacterized protein n=1 Tax=Terfezia boudieri ATCC MYA-4762 TaxID=1051890 RepID=A0A3N4LA78_9PEZI|nr:hypothetical protein L211DRAFT_895965 [Terfezia boudieri ATCC MYA-4762]